MNMDRMNTDRSCFVKPSNRHQWPQRARWRLRWPLYVLILALSLFFARQPAQAAPLSEISGGPTIDCPGGLTAAGVQGSVVVSATVGDLVWHDANSNGIREEKEMGVGDVEVTATCSGSDVAATAVTDQRGNYAFEIQNPSADSIYLTFTPPPGYTLTLQGQGKERANDSDPDPFTGQTGAIAVAAGGTNLDQDAGLVRTVQPPAICGTIYNDRNGSGQIDEAAPKLAAFQVMAFPNGSNNPVGMATSMNNGRYCIALPNTDTEAQYLVRQVPVDDWSITFPRGDQPLHQVTVPAQGIVGNINFANYNAELKLCGYKYHDLNGNGVLDPGEPPLSGWTFEVTTSTGATVGSATSGDNGRFCLGVEPGEYTVSEVPQTGWTLTQPVAGSYNVSVGQSSQHAKLIFGNTQEKAKICGVKFNDVDGDGIQDPGEVGLPGWTIEVQLPGGSTVSVVTGAHGRYCIDLPAGQGNYTVSEVMQSGWEQTHPASPGTYTFALAAGSGKDGVNFGNRKAEANLCVGKRPSLSQAISYTLSTNKLAVATCYADGVNDIYVMGVMDVSGHATAPTHPAEYMPPMYHHPDWTRAKMGNIFGLTLDNAGNMYVTATSAYWVDIFGPAGPGGIYKIDGITGNVSTFASLPNNTTVNPALGNITYDPASNRFYVSNLDDGLIYELDSSGATLNTYDHGVTGRTSATLSAIADAPSSGFTPVGRRIWGLEVHNGRLYYGVWWENFNNGSASEANEIWSIPLSSFTTGPAQLEITMPAYSGNYSNPVADISFSPTGALMAAERGIYNETGSMAHQARVLEFVLSGAVWVASANTFEIGDINPKANAAGGVDYDYAPGGWVWATGDALRFTTPPPPPETGVVYGLQGLPPTAGSIGNSTITDLNGFFWQDKNEIGDVELACPDPKAEQPDLTLSKSHLESLHFGQSGVYSLTVTNVGSGPTTGPIIVTDQLPPGITYNSVSGAGWSCVAGAVTPSGQTITCAHAGPLAAGGSLSFQLNVNVGAQSDFPNGGQIKNCADVDTDGDLNPQNDDDCDETTVTEPQKPPDLAVEKVHMDDFVFGQNGMYSLTVTNVGSGPTTGPIVVTDQLPPGITFVSASGAGWSCSAGAVTPGGQTVTCSHAGPLAPGNSLVLVLTVAIGTASDFPNGPLVKNCADVESTGDTNPQNDTDCDETTVVDPPKPPDLTVDKQHVGDFQYGQSGLYSLTVTNVGSGPTTGPIVVTDQLPPGVTYSSVSGAGWSCVAGPVTPTGQTVTCTHAGPLAPGNSLVFSLTVNVGTAAQIPGDIDQVRNCVQVQTENDENNNNNRDCDDLIVTGDQCVQPPSGLVGWWPLDEASGPTAADIANVNDGVHTNGPVPVTGKVAGALRFDGVNDYVQAPDHPSLDFSASIASTALGDFSIDAWIFWKESSDLRMIVDKRQRQNDRLRGYSFFVRGGLLGMSLADNTESVYNSGFAVTPNQWHLVAVTVDRDQSDGIRFYVDGVEVGTRGDPTLHPNTLANDSPLRIGSSTLAVTNIFNGNIDEVEIFNRVVTAGEIASIYDAGAAGKCKDQISLPWDTPVCKDQNNVTVAVSVCNHDVVAHTYVMPTTGGIVGLPAGAHPSCSVAFPNPTTYTILTAQPINVPAGQCVPISVQIAAPATLTANGQVACFTANVQNMQTSNLFSADSALWDHRNYCATPISNGTPLTSVVQTPISTTLPLRFTISNTSGSAANLPWTLRIVPTDMQGENEVAGLNGQPPGQPVNGTLSLGKDGNGNVDFNVQFNRYEPFRTYDVLLETEATGVVAAGEQQVAGPAATLILSSITVQAQPRQPDSTIQLYLPMIAR